MSVARGLGLNGFKYFSNVAKPIDLNLNFIVDSTNGNGLGIRSLKSNGYVKSVFMNSSAAFTGDSHTSVLIDGIASGTSSLVVGMPVQGSGIPVGAKIASIVDSGSITLTAATTSSITGSITYQGVGSPNPAAGYAMIQFNNNFNYYLGGFSGQVASLGATGITSTTKGLAYVIATVGTTTLAQFQAAGLVAGITPAAGVSFIANATGALGGTGTLGTPGVLLANSLSVVGNPSLSLNNSNIASNGGAIINVQFMKPTDSSTTTLVIGSPADGTTVGMCFRFDGSSVTIDGI